MLDEYDVVSGPDDGDDEHPRDEQGEILPAQKRGGSMTSIAFAAMLGIAEVLEPEKTKVDIEQQTDRPDDDDDGLDLSFGDLPPLG